MTAIREHRPSLIHVRRLTASAVATAVAAAVVLAAGGAIYLAGYETAGSALWAGLVLVLLIPLTWSVIRQLRAGDMGVDAIALIAMAGALILQEYLAGAVIALMLSGGNALEERAGARARRELTALVARAPKRATLVDGGEFRDVPIEAVQPGDVVLVHGGEVLPVDGLLETDEALIDESALTGEALPVLYRTGGAVRSGTVAIDAIQVTTTRRAADSAYAAVVKLARDAQTQRAPFVRMADRYAALFLPLTIVVAAFAWIISGDATRALTVFVVATPCPLILAAPIALVSGVSRAARIGVLVKGAGVIERLGNARTVVLDKTGTVTTGTPEVVEVSTTPGFTEDEAVRLAASVDLVSTHPFAAALARTAQERSLSLMLPTGVAERPGEGISGRVSGRDVELGGAEYFTHRGYAVDALRMDGAADRSRAFLGVDGSLVGWIDLADPPRPDARDLVHHLHDVGIESVVLLTGDHRSVADHIGAELAVDRIYSEQTPEDKLSVIRGIRETPDLAPVVMVGDGINDAPALALADVGIAMGAAAATAATETADAVVLTDRIDRIVDAIRVGQRSLAIARQSVLVGMGLSLAAMLVACAGYLTPVRGALLQEAVDVAVILNALRALRE